MKHAASLPFDSIKLDILRYGKEENLRLTMELTEYCQESGIAPEAELGRVKDMAELQAILTTPEQALESVNKGMDFSPLGIFMGNMDRRGKSLARIWEAGERLHKH